MEQMSLEDRNRLIEAFKSMIRKSEKALSHMKEDAPINSVHNKKNPR